MNNRELQRINGRSQSESEAKAFNENVGHVSKAFGISWFVALGRMSRTISDIFKNYTQYFFLASIIISFISWIASTVEFATAANKNRGKTGNYFYNTFNFLFYFATAAVFTFVGLYIGGVMLVLSMFMDPIVNLGRTLYFGIRLLLTDDKELKAHFKAEALKSGITALIGGVVSGIFIVLMFVPGLPIAASIALGVVGVGIIASPFVIAAYNWIKAKITKTPEVSVSPEPPTSHYTSIAPLIEQANVVNNNKSHYYANIKVSKPASWAELRGEVVDHRDKIELEIARDKGAFFETFWPEEGKRRNKFQALTYLLDIIDEVEVKPLPDMATEDKPVAVAGYLFHYKDKNELIDKITHHVTDLFPGVYQSFGMKIGNTQACFSKAFLGIMEGMNEEPQNEQRYAL